MSVARPRVLLSAYQCGPGLGSVSQIGWEWYSRLARRVPVTLVTHVRNRATLEAAGAPLAGSEVVYIDTEWFAGPLYALAKRAFPRSEHSVFLISSLDFFVYDRMATRMLKARRAEFDVVHAVTPVSPSAHTSLTGLGLPVVRGPLNGGLRTPSNFEEFMRADSAWVYSARDLAKWFRTGGIPTVTLVANQASEEALSAAERAVAARMPEIAVDANVYTPTAWPSAPSAETPLRVLFVGRMIPAKALPLLFEAACRVEEKHPVELVLIGDGPMRTEWEARANALGLRAQFPGAQGPARIGAELSRAHVFCLPSIRESGGAVLLEAMAAARPVLAVNYGGPGELVTDRVGVRVCADSAASVIEGLERALLDVTANPERWREMGEEGRRHVLATHTWERRVEAGLGLYSELTRSGEMGEAA